MPHTPTQAPINIPPTPPTPPHQHTPNPAHPSPSTYPQPRPPLPINIPPTPPTPPHQHTPNPAHPSPSTYPQPRPPLPINIPPTPPTPPQSIASRCWPEEISRWRGILNSTSHPRQWWRRCSRRGTAWWAQCELGGWRADGHALHGTGRGSATDQSASKLVSQWINFKTLPQICQWTSQSTNYWSTASNLSVNKSVN